MRQRIMMFAMLLVVATILGCDRNRESDEKAEQVNGEQESAERAGESDEREQAAGGDEAETSDEGDAGEGEGDAAEAARAVNVFGHALLTGAEEGNYAASPTSIATAMAMVYAGAGGETASEIAAALRYPDDGAAASLGRLGGRLAERSREGGDGRPPLELSLVDDLWLQAGFELGDAYLEQLDRQFGAAPREVDFRADPDDARSRINEYVAEQTREKIPELLPGAAVTEDTRTVLTNALYLNAPWKTPFPEDATREQPFATPDGDEQVPTMRLETQVGLAEGDEFRAVSLPYAAGELAALVVLPDEGQREAVEEAFDAETFATTVESLERTHVDVKLPKFEVRRKVDVREKLGEMGVERAFDPEADFEAIHEDLFVQAVRHEAYVAVDEKGTEAAAATAAGMGVTSMPPETVEFFVDRPFLFYVYDEPTGAILFATRIVDPAP